MIDYVMRQATAVRTHRPFKKHLEFADDVGLLPQGAQKKLRRVAEKAEKISVRQRS
jgi:hypothetical protein